MTSKKLLLTVSALAILSGAGPALADANTAYLDQQGGDNSLSIEQTGSGNFAGKSLNEPLLQAGSNNAATLLQGSAALGTTSTNSSIGLYQGGNGDVANTYQHNGAGTGSNSLVITQTANNDQIGVSSPLEQTGTNNVLIITQTTDNQVLNLSQAGSNKTTKITQGGLLNNTLNLNLLGNSNSEDVTQNGSSSVATVNETSFANHDSSRIFQATGTTGDLAEIDQSGAYNTAVIGQYGNGSTALIIQDVAALNSYAEIYQNSSLTPSSGTIHQNGTLDYAQISQTTTGVNATATINQNEGGAGGSNAAYIVQYFTGGSGTVDATVTQNGSGNYAYVSQNASTGGNLSVHLVQN